MGKFYEFLTELHVPDENFSKYQWLFTKLGVCIDIVKIDFGISDGQISSIFDMGYLPATCPYFIS